MRYRTALLATSLLVGALAAGTAGALSEFGIEGMHVVSTRADEVRASVAPDGQRIVWARSRREDGAHMPGWELWQARLIENRWQDAIPLSLNGTGEDFDPAFSGDGRWLYFASNREGGAGGTDLYRAPVLAAGGFGEPQSLGPGVNGIGDERAPSVSGDGLRLLFAGNGHGGAGGFDLFVAHWDGAAFVDPRPLPGINTVADETDAAWLGDGEAIVFVRSDATTNATTGPGATAPTRLYLAQCDGSRYADAAPLALSFNTAEGRTLGPALDWSRPGELLVSGIAPSPRAGQTDIYRMKAPTVTGSPGRVE
jgi:Tol biopolymer transport system component